MQVGGSLWSKLQVNGKCSAHGFDRQRNLNVTPGSPQGQLIECCSAAKPPVLAAQEHEIIGIHGGEVGYMSGRRSEAHVMAVRYRRMRRLHHGLVSARYRPIVQLIQSAQDGDNSRKMRQPEAMQVAPDTPSSKLTHRRGGRLGQDLEEARSRTGNVRVG